MVYVLEMTSPSSPDFCDHAPTWLLFQRVLPDRFFEQLSLELGLPSRQGIYSVAIVIWLMIYQRLHSKGTLSSTVHWLARHAAQLPQAQPCLRVRQNRISTHTGGYCQARQKLPTLVVTRVMDQLFTQLQQQMRETRPEVPRPMFVVDGTTLRTPAGKALAAAFPPGHNQHGENHWPTMLVVGFHDAHTGLATRPSWGAMYGDHATSEQRLAAQALASLPADAVVMGDGNFGIFAFAHTVLQTQRPVLLRLTETRAGKVLAGNRLRPGRRRRLVWQASAWDRRGHPELPAQAQVEGWLIACRNPGRPDEILYFFTTLDLKPTRILALYKLRWNIETDLRSLKRTVDLHQLTSQTVSMVEKELLAAVSAYNLIRAFMYLAAREAGVSPRQLSFSTCQDAVMAALPDLLRARTERQWQREMERLLPVLIQAKLPTRARRRSYPREIWGRGGHFPCRRSAPVQEPGR